MKCTKCEMEFTRTGVFVAHYRHHHTFYEEFFEKCRKNLAGVKGMTNFQKRLMAKQQARLAIEDEIEAQVAIVGAQKTEAAGVK